MDQTKMNSPVAAARGLCGWFGTQANPGRHAAMLDRLGNGPHATAAGLRAAALGLLGTGETLIEQEGMATALIGHPRLGDAATQSPAAIQALAQRVTSDGPGALAQLHGDFAIAILDEARGKVTLAVDRMGIRNLVYTVRGTTLLFGTSLDALAAHPDVDTSLSMQALYDYVYFHVVPGWDTIFRNCRRVPPGHCLIFEDGKARIEPYWQMRFTELSAAGVEEQAQQLRQVLESCTARAAEGARTAAFLSGGTDSSTVSGYLAKASQGPAQTYSIGFEVAAYDELEYARLAARHFGNEHREYYVTPADVTADAPRIAASYDQPFGNASAVAAYRCALFARNEGVERMLAGDGGDELFGGNARYARHKLLAAYGAAPLALRRLAEAALLSTDLTAKLPVLRKARSYVEQARPPMPDRYENYNLLDRLGPQRVFTRDFLAQIDTGHPRTLLRDAHRPFQDNSLINQMLGIDFRFTLADSDLPKVTRMCELAGVDVAFPLLDDDLVAFSAQLPPDLKLRGRELRWFFKHALRDFLPPEVITKQKHGFGVPVGEWMQTHAPLGELARASVASLRNRGIFEPKFLDELTSKLLAEHPGYYGVMVWILMMLGLWLDDRKL
jgi:asparagine synthase (glutamine-hydrolysing)